MSKSTRELETLQDIKRMMERSSRFISLSGWSGITAGICALAGAFAAHHRIHRYYDVEYVTRSARPVELRNDLIIIAALTFIVAFIFAIIFTYLKSKKEGVAIWGTTARRLMWNTVLPLIAGGFVICRMISLKQYDLIAPVSLVFYGLALINGSKYTMGEVRWLGYGELILGLISLWVFGYELIFWAFGFGFLHIIYGIAMWLKYDRSGLDAQPGNEVNS